MLLCVFVASVCCLCFSFCIALCHIVSYRIVSFIVCRVVLMCLCVSVCFCASGSCSCSGSGSVSGSGSTCASRLCCYARSSFINSSFYRFNNDTINNMGNHNNIRIIFGTCTKQNNTTTEQKTTGDKRSQQHREQGEDKRSQQHMIHKAVTVQSSRDNEHAL